jgi:putative SOS response-associated peptidase YedK
LWERWRIRRSAEPLESCALVTTARRRTIAHIHDRMPVIIPPSAYSEWLDRRNEDTDRLDRLLSADAAGPLVARPVGRDVSNAATKARTWLTGARATAGADAADDVPEPQEPCED